MRRVTVHAFVLLIAVLAFTAGIWRRQGGTGSARAIGAIQPRISPGGESISFSYQGAIWRLPRDGGEMRRLTSGFGFDSNPAWSADGKRLAYFGGQEFRVIDAETGAPIALPTRLQGFGKIYFHPDGKKVLGAFGETPRLSWLDLETGEPRQVLQTTLRVNVFGLSPDGSRIVYVTTQDIEGEQTGYNGPQADLWIIPSDGGEAKKLVQFRSRIFDLWWGREGLTVASDLGGAHNDLWTIPLDDPANARRITSGQADEDSASSSADGRWMVYTDNREGATALVCRELETGAERTLPVTGMDFGAPTGRLKIRLSEKGTGAPLTARVSVQQKNGKYFAPVGALYRMFGNLEHFYAAGEADLRAPAGSYVVRAFRGIEYLEARVEVDTPANGEAVASVELTRWTDPPSRGWWGGESHIHANYGYGQWYNTPARNIRDPLLTAYSAKALPVDVALGKIDSLDINGSYEATVAVWRRLLNCGLRLPASAGTDVFLNRIRSGLPGGDRAYVRLDGPFSYDAWVKGLKAGRSFVTNGPMLEFTANGKSPGETIVLAAPGEVRVKVKAEYAAPLSRIEVVNNGVVVAKGLLDGDGRSGSLDQALRIDKSGWLGVSAYGAGGRQAHTSPIYIEMASKRASSKDDAAYFLEWIDRLEARFTSRDRVPSEELRAHVKRQLDAARAVYRKAAE